MASVGLQDPSWSRPRPSEAQREVQALLDVPCMPAREGSDVVERLQQKHKERHEQLLTDLQEKLAAIDESLQPAVVEAAEDLRHKQRDSLQVVDAALARVSEELNSLTLGDVKRVWQEVESQLEYRLRLIEDLHKQLMAIEEQRTAQVCECLQQYSGMLESVAYCSHGDLASLMEDKAHSVNMASLANRQSASRLCAQLTAAERDVTLDRRAKWGEEAGKWRDGVLRNTLSKFKVNIGVREGEEGEGKGVERGRRETERVKRELIAELSGLQHRKQEVLTQLSSLTPSTIIMEKLHQLKEISCNIDQQMKSCLQRQLLGLSQAVEEMNSACEVEMEACKEALLLSGVCDSTSVYEVLNADYLPLTQKLIEESRAELLSIEQSVEARLAEQQSWFQSVLQYGIGASQLWRDYSSALVEVKRSQGETLEQLRVDHDTGNQNREANLDLVLDHMRQAPNEEVLDQYLQEATALLKAICEGYEEFHSAVLAEVGVWSAGVERCVCEYDTALCQYLGVGRAPPTTSSKKDRGKAGSRAKASSKRAKKATPTPTPRSPSVAAIVEEVIVGGGAIRYYVTPESPAGEMGGAFLTQNEESEGAPHLIANQALPLSKSTYKQTRSSLRATYLGHLEAWKEEVRVEGERERREKEEEAHTEFDLRLHLHKPRLARITHDIHGVRTAELLAHRDRLSRHARAVLAAITDIKATALTASDSIAEQKETYFQEMESLESCLAEAVSTVRLKQVEQKARNLLEKRLLTVDCIATDLRSTAENAIADLTSANTAFRQSLKLFSEAGNYCPEEVELFSRKLDRLAVKLSAAQQQATTAVTEATSEHTQTARETFTQTARETFTRFQNTYQLHWTDACYVEEVKRSLTNLQLSIRSVVANSNSQASKLHDAITKLTNILEESGDNGLILEGVPALVDLCTQRTAYLYCRATVQQGGRVGGERESRPNQPISAVNITTSIRDHTRVSSHHQSKASGPPAVQPQVKDAGRKTGTMSRRKTMAVVERRNVNFGVGGGEDGTSCFLPQIRALLSSNYANLYTTTEVYYRGKGARPVTSPTMAGSCEEALDRLIENCQTYRRQCEEYRNKAITEFRGQLDSLLSLLVGVAPRVLEGVKVHHMKRWEREREQLRDAHRRTMDGMRSKKLSHEKALHPGLGHPAATEELKQLRQAEQLRHDQCLEYIQHHRASMQSAVQRVGKDMAVELVAETKRLLTLCDTVPTTNEIIPGCVEKTELPVELLLREKLRPSNKSKADEEIESYSSQAGRWPGLAADLLDKLCLDSEERDQLSRGSESQKSSAAHSTLVTARDTALQEFVLAVEEEVMESERCGREEREKEQHWWEHWNHSLRSLAQLYST